MSLDVKIMTNTTTDAMDRKAAIDAAREALGPVGAMLHNSKYGYAVSHANNLFAFNANVCTREHGTIWSGDLDVTVSEEVLKTLSSRIHADLFILGEHDTEPMGCDYFLFDERAPRSQESIASFSPDKAFAVVSAQRVQKRSKR